MENEAFSPDHPLPPSLLKMRLRWDVFLSFRGEDTRHGFTGSLHAALDADGVRAFIDNEGLAGGDEIAPSLVEAIRDSAAAVAVISPRYADSRWCLEELARLFECRRLVIPVFYRVNPSDVRRQSGPFGDAFRVLTRDYGEVRVNRWKEALEKAGNRSGYPLAADSDESQAIKMIVRRVLTELNRIPVHVAAYPVGLDSRVNEVISSLNLQYNGVQFLGIHGLPGVGKTTLAKAALSKLVAYFKRRCFIANLKETLEKEGLCAIQNKLICDLSMEKPVDDENAGKLAVRRLISSERHAEENGVEESGFHDKRILVVLDDVVGADQLEALGIQRKWFTNGSRIIATSRDKDILLSFAYENELHEAKELYGSEALELFSYHALRRKEPTEELMSLSKDIVSCTGGLPLALEVFGSVLLDKKTKREWEASLKKLRRIRPSCLQDVLKLSYDELSDEEKCMFLDISCLFIQMGMRREDTIDIFQGCGFESADEAIGNLIRKSLLKINRDDMLWMHDQLRDMGRQIVREQGIENLGNRSRLWNYDEVVDVLVHKMGTANIRGIILDTGRKNLLVDWSAGTSSLLNVWREPSIHSIITLFKKKFEQLNSHGSENLDLSMKLFEPLVKLKLLQINNVKLKSDFSFMPAQLRWLKWKGCPWTSLPSTIPQEIRVLDISESNIEYLWGWRLPFSSRNLVVKNLTVLNLSECYKLTSIPDLSGHWSLRKLILEGCINLINIHESLGSMTSLVHLNLRRCSSLIELPRDVSGLSSLEELVLSCCHALKNLPCDISWLKSLIQLHLDETKITELPDLFFLQKLELLKLDRCIQLKHLPRTIGNICSLKILSLCGSGVEDLPYSIRHLQSLEKLNLVHCKLLTSIPDSFGNLKSLAELGLTGSSISQLPDSICSLPYLKSLSLGKCSLHTLPSSVGGLSSLVELDLNGILIQELPDEIGSLKVIQTLQMSKCALLGSLPESIGNLFSLSKLNLVETSITELPESIGMLENLIILRLNKCKSLCRLPSSFGQLKSLCHLYMEETAITELPESFGMLSRLMKLKMKKKPHLGSSDMADNAPNHEPTQHTELPLSFCNLSLLKEFDARAWNIYGQIPEDFNKLSSMEILELGYNGFHSLPSSMPDLSVLKKLLLPYCQNLKSLPPLPSSLMELDVTNCYALSYVPDLSNLTRLEELQLTNCDKLQDVPGLEHLKSLRRVYMAGCNASASTVRKRLTKETCEKLTHLGIPGSLIPVWFSKAPIIFSSRVNSAVKCVMIGVVLSVKKELLNDALRYSPLSAVQVKILRATHATAIFSTVVSLKAIPNTSEDQLYLCRFKDYHPLVSLLKDGDKLEVSMLQFYVGCIELKRRGIFLVYENDDAYDGNEDLLEDNQKSVSEKLARFLHSL